MAILQSEHILRKNAYETLKAARIAGESVILTRESQPEIIMLTFDEYVRLRMAARQAGGEEAEETIELEQRAVDTTVCVRNCPFRSPKVAK